MNNNRKSEDNNRWLIVLLKITQWNSQTAWHTLNAKYRLVIIIKKEKVFSETKTETTSSSVNTTCVLQTSENLQMSTQGFGKAKWFCHCHSDCLPQNSDFPIFGPVITHLGHYWYVSEYALWNVFCTFEWGHLKMDLNFEIW